jgi:diguanylate cyclase (GGDEF)-like protein/putative nucleotidyltransferase with HDIG domain
MTIIYLVTIITSTIIMSQGFNKVIPSILAGMHAVLLIIGINYKLKTRYKYIIAILAFSCLYCAIEFFSIDFDTLSSVIYYVPLLYAYLLPDIAFPIIIGIIASSTFFKYMGDYSLKQVLGNAVGMISASAIYSIALFFMDRLSDIKDKYMNMSIRDSLTGLYNLNQIINIGEQYLAKQKGIAVFLFDIDHFKDFNDTYGHLIGNNILKQVAIKLQEKLDRYGGMAGRLGGDEFVVLMPEISLDKAKNLYDIVRVVINESYFVCDPDLEPIRISFSVGMSHSLEMKPSSMQQLLHDADMKMNYNKQGSIPGIVQTVFNTNLSSEQTQLLDLLAEKDMYSYIHSKYVVQYACWLLEALGYPDDMKREICTGAWLHDVGKLSIKNDILRKVGKLNDEEYALIKNHVKIGLAIVERFTLPEVSINSIKFHHERWDGRGYPYGIKGGDTPIEGRILQIADSFSAMTIKRVYRKNKTMEEAVEELRKNKETQFDPELVELFASIVDKYNT